MSEKYDVIIIGAGMSGLAAGIRLARHGRRVCLLERHHTIGGLNSFYRLRGQNHDVGLHAVTNYAPRGTRSGPLAKLLRQLKLSWEDFTLSPQIGSEIIFPSARLQFNNDIEFLHAEIAQQFPGEQDNFTALLAIIADYDEIQPQRSPQSARETLGEIFCDPLLVEMLLCPPMWYGNACEDDMEWGQYCILFRSIFLEGLARPFEGVRLILRKLIRRYREFGGELKLRSGVERIVTEHGRATRVILDDGSELRGNAVISSAGWNNTMRMCDSRRAASPTSARISLAETISVLSKQPRQLGLDRTMIFFNTADEFRWRRPDGLCDDSAGVICTPNNYQYGSFPSDKAQLSEGVVRVTTLANFDRWSSLANDEYLRQKEHWFERILSVAEQFVPSFRDVTIDTDMFTPQTIARFTSHEGGAVYGSPQKQYDGRTHLENVFICGADQGLVGIVGAMTSGISIANQRILSHKMESASNPSVKTQSRREVPAGL